MHNDKYGRAAIQDNEIVLQNAAKGLTHHAKVLNATLPAFPMALDITQVNECLLKVGQSIQATGQALTGCKMLDYLVSRQIRATKENLLSNRAPDFSIKSQQNLLLTVSEDLGSLRYIALDKLKVLDSLKQTLNAIKSSMLLGG